jgi:hypothetical protein
MRSIPLHKKMKILFPVIPYPFFGNNRSIATMSVAQNTIFVKLEAKNLKSKDLFSKSDPFAVAYIRNRNDRDSKWKEVGRTEAIKNDQNPKWKTTIKVPYCLHDMQELKFELYDSDSSSKNLSKHDKITEFTTPLSKLLTCAQGAVTFDWDKSSLTARYESGTSNNDTIKMTVKCKGLPRMDVFGKGDPYFIIEKKSEDGQTYVKIFESTVIKNTKDPEWKINTSVRALCNGAMQVPMRVSLYDWEKSSAHDLIGSCDVVFEDVVRDRNSSFELKHPSKKKGRGTISFNDVVLTHIRGFTDLIKGGLNMNIDMAIDFTGSNGDPNDTDSLHYYQTYENAYQQAISRIGEAVIDYDSNNDIQMFGFGGQPKGADDVSHCFPLKYDGEEVGIQKALEAYKSALNNVKLSGPTKFSHVLSNTIEKAKKNKHTKNYYTVIIVTDGIINDMGRVKELLVEACELPLSVIIIGVGKADFTDMCALDSDNLPLKDDRGFAASRDIVNFVELNKLSLKGKSSLAEATLAELPSQVETYYNMYGKDIF